LVEPEALLALTRIDRDFFRQLQRLEPFGIGHAAPVFWSRNCRIADQKLLRGGHLQLQLEQDGAVRRAMAWRWTGETPLRGPVDVAYRLRLDRWQGQERLQLELVGLRASSGGEVVLQWGDRRYWCRLQEEALVIRNAAGDELHSDREEAMAQHPYLKALIREASTALGLTP
jgi:single-stranded-DNA-specific exonuclease